MSAEAERRGGCGPLATRRDRRSRPSPSPAPDRRSRLGARWRQRRRAPRAEAAGTDLPRLRQWRAARRAGPSSVGRALSHRARSVWAPPPSTGPGTLRGRVPRFLSTLATDPGRSCLAQVLQGGPELLANQRPPRPVQHRLDPGLELHPLLVLGLVLRKSVFGAVELGSQARRGRLGRGEEKQRSEEHGPSLSRTPRRRLERPEPWNPRMASVSEVRSGPAGSRRPLDGGEYVAAVEERQAPVEGSRQVQAGAARVLSAQIAERRIVGGEQH